MLDRDGEARPSVPCPDAMRVLELFSLTSQISFDRVLASRALSEAERAVTGDDWPTWARRLVEVGESLDLRIRSVESGLEDVLSFVQQGLPVATCVDDPDGGLRWLLVAEARGRKVRVIPTAEEGNGRWMTLRRLRRALRLADRDRHCRWVIGHPALPCEVDHDHEHEPGAGHDTGSGHGPHSHGRVKPFRRLLGLLRPDKRDLWMILVFSMVVGVLALASPIAVEALVNTVAFGRYLQPVVILAVLLGTFLAFAAAMRGLLTYIVEILQRRLFVRVLEDLAYRLPRVKQDALDQQYGPELVNRFFDVVTLQKSTAVLLLDGISLILQTVIGMAVLAFYHPFLLGFDIVLLGWIIFIIFGLGRGAVRTAVRESRAKYAVAAWLEELARHSTAFKIHSGTQFAMDRMDQLAIRWLDARRAHFRILIRQVLFGLGLHAMAGTALLGLGGWLVISGELTLGQLVAAELIVVIIVGAFSKLGKHLESLYDLLAAVDKLGLLFDLPTEPHDKLFHMHSGDPARISMRNVTCSIHGHTVVKGVTLSAEPGESLAIVGAAASGKSTIIDLLAGIRQPSAGHVELDGIDLRELRPDSLREHFSVARSIEIFQGTIAENVHLCRPDISARDVREALDMVGLLDEILTLPEGLYTTVTTNGGGLSCSQAARLMLARAVVGRPRLLLIDGTLDVLPDDGLSELLTRLTSERTCWTLLVTTGRRAVIDACDRVFHLTPPPADAENAQHLDTPLTDP